MEEKLTLWKKLKISITNFEGYQDLAAEKIGKTILYIFILVFIFSIVLTGLSAYQFANTIENGEIKQYIKDNIDTITLKEGKLKVTPKDKSEEIKILVEDLNTQITINTTDNEETKKEKIEEIKSMQNGILILNDRLIIKNEMMVEPHEYFYQEEIEQLGISNINIEKEDIIEYLSIENMMPVILTGCAVTLISVLISLFPTTLIDILLFSAMGYIFTRIARVRIRYSAVYNISAYSLTLPIILNIIYVIVNFFTGFTIKYFDIMYTAITSIYIITAILMIKSEVIKKQIELAKIIQEQEKVRQELQQKEEEEKEKKEREEQKKKEKEEKEDKKDEDNSEAGKKTKKNKKNNPDINIGNEPEGNNV